MTSSQPYRSPTHRVEREDPDVPLYADMLLLFDALEREDPTGLFSSSLDETDYGSAV